MPSQQKMNRKEEVLSKLLLLNKLSVEEGLAQLILTELKITVKEIFEKRRSLIMTLFKPSLLKQLNNKSNVVPDESQQIIQDDSQAVLDLNIMEKALEFCSENQLDCNATKVFVNNVDYKVRQRDLWDFFEYFGKVLRCTIVKDKRTKRSRGFAFVIYSTPLEAKRALEAKKYELRLNGRLMTVERPTKRRKQDKALGDYKASEKRIQDATQYFLNEGQTRNEDSESSDDDPCHINKLCNDILVLIFTKLDLLSRVRCELVLTDRILISLLKKGCNNLKSVDLSHSPYLLSYNSLFLFGNMCKNLEELNLSRVPVNNKTLKHFGTNLLKLKKLILNDSSHIGEKGLWWLFKDLKYLEHLELTSCHRLYGKCIYMLPLTLKSISFQRCSMLSDIGLQNLTLRCPYVAKLDLSYCLSITSNGLANCLKSLSALTHLNLKSLSTDERFSHESFLALKYCTNLTNNYDIPQEKDYKDVGVKNQVELNVSENRSVDDTVLNSITQNCTNLRVLNLAGCHSNITCEGIKPIKMLDFLEDLNISYLKAVCDDCLSHLCSLHCLRRLAIAACYNFTNSGALQCICSLYSLDTLDMSGCHQLNDDICTHEGVFCIDGGREKCMNVIVGGSEMTTVTTDMLREKLPYVKLCFSDYSVGMLKLRSDPTYIGPFNDDDFDDEDDSEDEDEIPDDVIEENFVPNAVIFDESSRYDEDGFPLWEVIEPPSPTPQRIANAEELDLKANATETQSVSECLLAQLPLAEEEDWDNELDEGREWNVNVEDLNDRGNNVQNDTDDFLIQDDPMLDEIIG